MHLSRSFALKVARSAGLYLTMLASLTLVDNVILAQEAAAPKVNPATGSPAQARQMWPGCRHRSISPLFPETASAGDGQPLHIDRALAATAGPRAGWLVWSTRRCR